MGQGRHAPPALLPPVEVLERRIDVDEHDLQARRDRGFNEDVGRRKMLDVFQMAAAQEGLVHEYRSRLSSILF